jgi:two-component system alkaline phosphatase synthesis response regulator PhoP/two-component system response regulator VicR
LNPILVVDDDAAIRDIVELALKAEGYPVESASNGAEALWVTERYRPALILLDLDMPVLSGPEFAAEIRRRYADPAPVVVVSSTRSAWQWAQELRAANYLEKPFELDELLAIVGRLLAAGR